MINKTHDSPLTAHHSIKGSITPAILVITSAFIVVIYGVLFVLTLQFDFSRRQIASEASLNIAEAGVNYYRWHLAHDPDDYQDGTGSPGPYVHDYTDPQGATIGKYSLVITPPSAGSSIVTIESTGWLDEFPKVTRVVEAQYGIPSFSKYSFLSNSSSWYGNNITVNGQIHSNNGIRMDGTNLSLVTSAKDTYQCGSETGCNPPQSKPGVWGTGSGQGLWQFPVPSIDFNSISFDFAQMKTDAQNTGLYLDDSNARGYHLLFLNDGTVRINRVTNTNRVRAYAVPGQGLGPGGQGGCKWRDMNIANETLVGIYDVSTVPIIFIEDNIWIEGQLDGRLTVVAARFPIQSSYADIWIPNNITYTSYDGSDSLGLIAQNDIFFTRDIPLDFQVDAILLAQQGKVIRHGYFWWCGGTSQAVKDKLTINGSLISFDKSYWNFGSAPVSGFIEREINYDSNNLLNPPPYFPTSGDYELLNWIEK